MCFCKMWDCLMSGWSLDMSHLTSGCWRAWFRLWFHNAVLFYIYILRSHLLLLGKDKQDFQWFELLSLFREMMENSSPFWICCTLQMFSPRFCHTSYLAWNMCCFINALHAFWLLFSFFRATLYVGKYSTSLYASPSLVHDGVTVVVSDGCTCIFI